MTDSEYIVFGKPYIGEEEIREVEECLRSGWLGTGPRVQTFQNAFASYVGAEHAVALGSCTAGLFLAQLSLGIGPGDAVLTTPMTFVATMNSIAQTGATPIFADVELDTALLDLDQVERVLREECAKKDGELIHIASCKRMKALLPVHLYGRPLHMEKFRELADRFGLYLIEDAAHAIETTVGDQHVGTTADISCFSFYATKNLCTGEGGMVTTANEDWANRIRTLSQHGLSKGAWRRFSDEGYKHYRAMDVGWKFNMMDLQAAIGIHQLARLEERLVVREQQWQTYLEELAGLPGVQLPVDGDLAGRHARHLFTLRVTKEACLKRDEALERLHGRGIGSGVHYLSVNQHPAYEGRVQMATPNADRIGEEILSIPLGGALTSAQQARVIDALREVFV